MLTENTREKMQDTIVKALGFENELTIWFFKLCEQYEDNPHNNRKLFEIIATLLILAHDASELE